MYFPSLANVHTKRMEQDGSETWKIDQRQIERDNARNIRSIRRTGTGMCACEYNLQNCLSYWRYYVILFELS